MSVGELWIYLGFFAVLVAAGLGFPAPEELVITGGGVVAGQLPPEPKVVEVPMAYPSSTDVAGLLAANPYGGFPGALPWAALVRTPPRELSDEEVTSLKAVGLLAINPQSGFPGGLPWAVLAGAGPPIEKRTIEPPNQIHVHWWILLPVCIVAVVLSDLILYGLGLWGGDRLLRHRWLAHLMPPQRRQRTEENFHRYGVTLLVFGRLVPGIRAPLFLTAGSMRLPLPRFLLADGIGAVVGNSCFFFLGFWLGDSVKTLIEHAEERLKPILIIVAVGLAVAFFLWHFLRHPVSTGDPSEVPLIGPQVASHIEQAEEHPPCSDKPINKEPTPVNHPPAPDQRARRLSLFLIFVGAGVLASCLLWRFRRQIRK